MSEEKEMSIIQMIQTYGVEFSKSFLQGKEMMEAVQSIERITENIMVQLNVSEKDWLFDQLTSLQNAFNFSKEIEDKLLDVNR